MRIEDYALIGDTQTAALVGRDGAIDWRWFPRFARPPACFAALLGSRDNGRWRLAPAGEAVRALRYRPDTIVLDTDFTTPEGTVRVTDCMDRFTAVDDHP